MSNLEDLLETSSVKETKPKFLAEYQLPGQNDMITIDIRSAPPAQVAEWFDTMDSWEIQHAFLEMREAYNDLIKSPPTTPATGVIINTEMLRDFTVYAGTNLKTFAIENGTSLQHAPVLNKRIMKTEDRAKIINDLVKIWRDNIRNHEDWNKYKRHLAYQFERLGMYPTVFIVNNKERGEQLIKAWVNYFASLIDAESEKDDKDIIRQVQDQESEILYHVLKAALQKDTNLNVHIQDARNPTSSVPRDVLGVYILAHGGERFTEMTVDSLIKTLMQNFTFFTRASRFKTFESWFLQYIEHTKRMIETHGNITFHHLMIANAILALDHMVRYKTWMRNKRVEFPQRLSDIYADAPKFLNGLLQDIRRLDATWVTHNDNAQTKMPQMQHQKAMITFITNMLGVDLKDQNLLPAPTTFTTFKEEKGPCTYCKQDTHTWEQCRNRTQDHQLKKDVGSLHVLLNEQNRLLTKVVEKKVESKEAQEILAKNLQTLYRLTIAGRKIQGTQVQKANTPSTQQQKNVGGQQSFKENRNMGNVKSQGQTTHAPKFQPKANVAMGAKTASKDKESATPPPKTPKNKKFAGTMMVDAFDPDMLCFQTQLNDEDEFEAMQMRPYSGNPVWLQRKLPSLTSSDWYTASHQELVFEYEAGILTSWEYSAENEKLLDVMAGNGRIGKNESPIVWETRAPCYDILLTDADCFARTTDDDLILHNHVQVNCLYSAVLQLICLRDSIAEYGGATLPAPKNPKLAILQQFKGKGLQGHSLTFRQDVQDHVTYLSQNLGAKNKDLMTRGKQSHTFRQLTSSFTPKEWEMYLALSKHEKQPATLIEVAALSDMLGETIEIYRLTPRQNYQKYATLCPSDMARNYEHKTLKLFFHEEHYFGITPNHFGVIPGQIQLVTDKQYVRVQGGMMYLDTKLHPKISSQDLTKLQFRLHVMGSNTYTRTSAIPSGNDDKGNHFAPLNMPQEIITTILQESPLLMPDILRIDTEITTYMPRLAEVVNRMQTLIEDTMETVSSEYGILKGHSTTNPTEIFKVNTYPAVERNYQLQKNIEEFMRVTGPNTDTKYAQLWDALSHKVNEYKQYLNEKSTHLTRSIPHAGFKFKFLHMQQLLNVSLDSIQLILREKDLTTKVFTDDGNQMLDFIQPVEVKSDTSTSPSQDLFIDTLAALLVPDHDTVSPEQEEKLIQVSHKVKDKVQETITMTPLLLEDEFNEQQIVSIDTIWHPPVLDLTKLTEKEVMNLCIQCLQAPKYVEPDGRIHEYCGKSCAISAGVLPFPCMFETCPQCLTNPKWIEDDGRVRDYCGKTCAMRAGALLKATGTISLPNPQPIPLIDPHQFNIQLDSLRMYFWKWKVIVIESHLRQRHDVKDWRGILQLTGKVREADIWWNMREPQNSQNLQQKELFQSTSSSPTMVPSSASSWYDEGPTYQEELEFNLRHLEARTSSIVLHTQALQDAIQYEREQHTFEIQEERRALSNYTRFSLDATQGYARQVRQLCKDKDELEDELRKLQQLNQTKEEELIKVTDAFREYRQDAIDAKNERESLRIQVGDLQIEAEMLQKENAILSEIRSSRIMAYKIAELEEQCSMTLETIEVKDDIIETLQSDLAFLQKERQTLKTDMDIKQLTYDTALEALSDQNSDLRNQIDIVTDRCNDIISRTLDESQNISVDKNETDMLKLQSNQMTHKVYNLASNLLDLHQGQMNNMLHDIGRTLSNTKDIGEWMIGIQNISQASLQTFVDSFERIKAEFQSYEINATESTKKHWFMNFQQTTFYQLVIMTASLNNIQPYPGRILTHSQQLRMPRFTLDKPHDTFIEWIMNGFQGEPPYDSIEAYSYALKDHLAHVQVSQMTALKSMLIFDGQMLSIKLAIALFMVFKHKPANVKGEAPYDMIFTMHTQHIPPNDMMLMMRRLNDYVETVVFRYDIKAWATPDHLIGVLNQGETLPDTKIDIVYPPITPNVTMDKLIVKQPTAQIASPCVKPKLEKTPKSILRVSEKQMYVTPAKEGAGTQSRGPSTSHRHPWTLISAKIDTPFRHSVLNSAKATIHQHLNRHTEVTPTPVKERQISRINTPVTPIEHFNTSSDKGSKCDPRLISEPNLMTPKSSKDVKQISKPLTPVTPPKSSTSKQLTPVTPSSGMVMQDMDKTGLTPTALLTPSSNLPSSAKTKSKKRRKSKKSEIENLVIEPQPNALTILGDALMNGIRTMSEKTRYPTRASKRS